MELLLFVDPCPYKRGEWNFDYRWIIIPAKRSSSAKNLVKSPFTRGAFSCYTKKIKKKTKKR
jgi:hypothetical protein